MDILIVAGVVGVVAVLIVLGVAAEKKHLRKVVDVLRGLGLEAAAKPAMTRDEASRAMDDLGRLTFKTGADGVVWTGSGMVRGRQIRVLMHRYTTGSGKSRTTHTNVVVSTPCPTAWPDLELTPEHFGLKVAKMVNLVAKDVQLESEEFNKKWHVKCASEDFAILALPPEVQTRLCVGKPQGTWWIGGAVCRVVKRGVRAEELPGLVAEAVEFFEMLPKSLDGWAAAPAQNE